MKAKAMIPATSVATMTTDAMKRLLRTLWLDLWGGDPPASVSAWLKRVFTPAKDCTRCGGIGQDPGDVCHARYDACSRCGGNGLEPRR